MSNVLFLDFDGPLFPSRTIQWHPDNRARTYPGTVLKGLSNPHSPRYWKMDEISVDMLNELYKVYAFDTVVSSSWRRVCSLEFIEELFQVNGLNLTLHEDWDTPTRTFRNCRRSEEINEWMEAHPDVEDCMVIDDRSSGESLFGLQQARSNARIYGDRKFVEPYPRIGKIMMVDEEFGISRYDFLNMQDYIKEFWMEDKEWVEKRQREEAILRCLM